MLLRTALTALLATACWQPSYGQYPTSGPASSADSTRPHRVVSDETTSTPAAPAPVAMPMLANGGLARLNPSEPAASSSAQPASEVAAQMDYGMETMPTDSSLTDEACCEGDCAHGVTDYVPGRHHAFGWSYWRCKGLPSPWCSPGNMSLHVPCNPCTGTYYYFRPYNWFHISEQQQEAANYNGDPRNPYDNRVVFDGLYDGM